MAPRFETRLAQSDQDLQNAQRLRYRVFVKEFGSDGPLVDHQAELERDDYDAHYDHILLIDRDKPSDDLGKVVGAYRVLPSDRLPQVGKFYTEAEFDLSPLLALQRKSLELGRSCLLPEYRGGAALYHLWAAVTDYIRRYDIQILFGVASFHGTETDHHKRALAAVFDRYMAPHHLRVQAIGPSAIAADQFLGGAIDTSAMAQVPALIKAYLRLGGFVGDGVFVDHAFNTTDVCLILDVEHLNQKQVEMFSKMATVL